MSREIVLDTETTGLSPQDGHRLIEIACLEVVDCIPTGAHFHAYIHPERDIDPDAERVHGISLASLEGKPKFHEIADELVSFIGDAKLIAHNAGFDRSFVDEELRRAGYQITAAARWVDTLAMAQKKFPGMYNSLDALCKRYKISLDGREKHGALIDTPLLASVYLELQGGRERALDLQTVVRGVTALAAKVIYGARPRPLASRLTAEEAAAHQVFLEKELKGESLWVTMAG